MSVDLVVVGLGSAGRSAAELAAALGARVVAVERARPGGDCLWSGCVPSKALLAAGAAAHAVRTAGRFGIGTAEPAIDLRSVFARVRAVQEEIAGGDDDPDRLRDQGIEVVTGSARLVSPTAVEVGERRIDTRFVLVATGSRPALPPIAGLASAAPITTDELFTLAAPPSSLVVLGGGPVGVELSQALVRLGVRITLVEQQGRLLPTIDAEAATAVDASLRSEGVDVRVGAAVTAVVRRDDGTCVATVDGGEVLAAGVLVATGRHPNIEGLGLDDVGVAVGASGIEVDGVGRTTVDGVFAAGDVTGDRHLTPWAAAAAGAAVRAMFVPGPVAAADAVPWAVFTDPEVAGVGASAYGLRAGGTAFVEHRAGGGDRAVIDGTPSEIVALTEPNGRLLGARALGPGASEVVHELALALRDGRRLTHLAGLPHVYPTRSAAVGSLAATASLERARRLAGRRRSR